MKKILVSLLLISMAVTFSSCKKEGVYKPKEKISRIYVDSGYGDGKKLEEVWTWDKKQLQRIDHYYDGDLSWSEEFTYNNKGQVERVDCYKDSEYTEYTYDGDKLSKATYYYRGSIVTEHIFKHEGENITEIEITYFDNKKRNSHLRNEGYNPLRMLLQGNNYQTLKNAIERVHTSIDIVTVKLEWEKKNVSKIEITEGPYRFTANFKYDDKLNPFKNLFGLYVDGDIDEGSLLSKNNVIEEHYAETSNGETYTGIIKYSYSYDGKFPTVQRYTYSYETPVWDYYGDLIGYETVTRTTSTYYEYE